MGHQEALCNRVTVEFTFDELAPDTRSRVLTLSLRVSPHKKIVKALKTCSRVLTLSLRVSPHKKMVKHVKAVIQSLGLPCYDISLEPMNLRM